MEVLPLDPAVCRPYDRLPSPAPDGRWSPLLTNAVGPPRRAGLGAPHARVPESVPVGTGTYVEKGAVVGPG
ncbi:hypothetical protein, partial [Cellulosimicrobium composti]|uniref:hypothetical protein n=1 Tax=Cellulosimicrobium composti TaxID=2672572 RepID=UPI0035E3C906